MSEQSRYRRMTEDETMRLIKARIQHEDLFKQKFYRRNENWTIIRNTAKLFEYNIEQLRTKWNNIYKQYKELVDPPTGVQTEDGELTAGNWEFFEIMHSYGASRHTMHPPLLVHSQHGSYVRNPNNSFTGADEVDTNSSEPISPAATNETSMDTERFTEPSGSRQLARNYRREGPPSRKRKNDKIYEKYKKECKRHKKESKCLFNFLEGFANLVGIPFERPSESDTTSDSE